MFLHLVPNPYNFWVFFGNNSWKYLEPNEENDLSGDNPDERTVRLVKLISYCCNWILSMFFSFIDLFACLPAKTAYNTSLTMSVTFLKEQLRTLFGTWWYHLIFRPFWACEWKYHQVILVSDQVGDLYNRIDCLN